MQQKCTKVLTILFCSVLIFLYSACGNHSNKDTEIPYDDAKEKTAFTPSTYDKVSSNYGDVQNYYTMNDSRSYPDSANPIGVRIAENEYIFFINGRNVKFTNGEQTTKGEVSTIKMENGDLRVELSWSDSGREGVYNSGDIKVFRNNNTVIKTTVYIEGMQW